MKAQKRGLGRPSYLALSQFFEVRLHPKQSCLWAENSDLYTE